MPSPILTSNAPADLKLGAAADYALLDAIPDMCLVVSEDRKVVFANSAAITLLGRTVHGTNGEAIGELVAKPFQGPLGLALDLCARDGEAQSMDCDFPAADGAVVKASLHIAPAPAMPGICVIVAHDVAKDRAKDLNLLRFANVAHHTVNPLEITDTKGRIVYVNPAFEADSGYTKEELLGKNPNVFGSGKHPKSFWQNMWNTIRSGQVWTGEVENKRRSGEAYYTQILISPIIDSDGEIVGYFGIHRDVTRQRYLEQQLVNAQKMESIGMLAAGLAHEVGNPLTSISSIVQVIQRTTKDDFAKEKLALIKSQISRISRIIRELVDFARQSTYEVVPTDLNRVIRDAVEIVRVGKKAKDIGFHLGLDGNLPQLPLVPDKIQQVFINILINAVDAMQEGSPNRRAAGINIRSRVVDDAVQVSIQDSGTGIPADAIPKIFDPFFTTKAVGEGTGLGLWVSYTIVTSFDGDIRVESTEDEGTTFTIIFPQRSTLT